MATTKTTLSNTYQKGKLYDIPLADLQADPNQPRKSLDAQALEELTASIQKHGVLEPILFRQENETLYVVAGERRVIAAGKAGLATIPAVFIEGNHAEIALVENLLRQDLTPVEEAEALQGLMDQQQYSQDQLSAIIGKARTSITELLSLNRLPQAIRDECRGDRKINKSALIEIAKKKQERAMLRAYQIYKDKQQKTKNTRTTVTTDTLKRIFGQIDKTVAMIGTIDKTKWSAEDLENLRGGLNALKERIDVFLNDQSHTPGPT